MTTLEKLNLALRSLMEMSIIAAFAYWGIHAGTTVWMKVLLGILAPILGFGVWGLVDFHRAGTMAEPLRLIEELAISGLAAVLLYIIGQHVLAYILALISIIHHILTYGLGETLIKT